MIETPERTDASLRVRWTRTAWIMLGALFAVAVLWAALAARATARDAAPPPDMLLKPQNVGMPWSFNGSQRIRRYEVRAADASADDQRDAKQRSETYASRKLVAGRTYLIRFEVLIEPGKPNTAKWMTLVQLQSTFDKGEAGHSPPFAVELKGERMEIVSRTSPARLSTPEDTRFTKHFSDRTDLARDTWHRMKIRVRFDPAGEGRLRVWRNGRRIVDYRGPIGFDDAVGHYYKEGVYRGSAPEIFAARFRKLTISDLSPRKEAAR